MEPLFAEFVCEYSKMVLTKDPQEWALLQRLFWFTVEFGLIKTDEDIRAYGGGILSSIGETVYAIESDEPERRPFELVDVLRTPYRIDKKQPIYYVINDFEQLYHLIQDDIDDALVKAHELGEFQPTFPVDDDDPNIHINWC